MALGPEERAGLRVLVDELGWIQALRVGLGVQWRTLRGEPFAHLAPATTFGERGSREQAGPAVLLYRVLQARVGPERALHITGRAVEEGALVFLARSIGPLRRAEIAALDEEGRETFARERGARFPNAELEWTKITADEVAFEVTACRLVELVHEVGHPELATLFCEGDGRYFGEVEPGAALVRPTTLAGGDDRCRFTIHWSDV